MKIVLKQEHLIILNLLMDDTHTGAVRAGNKDAIKQCKRLHNKFMPNARYVELKSNEIRVLSSILKSAIDIINENEIPQNDNEEEYKEHVENRIKNMESIIDLRDLFKAKLGSKKLIRKDLSSYKPEFLKELDE